MRLLLYNPNSDADLTSLLAEAASPLLHAEDTIGVATAEQGPRLIGSAEAIASAREILMAQLPEKARDYDAIILACFGDLEIEPIRRAVDKPILSLWDACSSLAPLSGKRFGLITTSQFWVEWLQSDIRRRGLSDCIRAVRAVSLLPRASYDALGPVAAQAIREMVAANTDVDAVILGGALLVVLRPFLTAKRLLPIFHNLAAAVDLSRALVHMDRRQLNQ
jgi:allantoin racemase